MGALREKLTEIVELARRAGRLTRDDDAKELWAAEYGKLSEGSDGMFGAVTSRAEAQVLRLSMLYALLDCSDFIRVPHLRAALEVWRYSEDCCRYIFGTQVGDPTADTILSAAKGSTEGLTRTEISTLFSKNKSTAQIGVALDHLREIGKLAIVTDKTSGSSGRPTQRWIYTGGVIS
jgi:hypothetical protein